MAFALSLSLQVLCFWTSSSLDQTLNKKKKGTIAQIQSIFFFYIFIIYNFFILNVELADGNFTLVQLKQGNQVPAVFDRTGEEVQCPLLKYEALVFFIPSIFFFFFFYFILSIELANGDFTLFS